MKRERPKSVSFRRGGGGVCVLKGGASEEDIYIFC